MKIARHHDRLRHAPAVRPRYLPQPRHQSNRSIRIRCISHHRLRRVRETALDPSIQPAEPLPATTRDPADPRHSAGNLRGLHPSRLHPPATVCCRHRPAAWTLFDLLWNKSHHYSSNRLANSPRKVMHYL